MAFILGQDDDEQNGQAQQAPGSAPLVGGGSAAVGASAGANSGVGKGGQGGWTNMQNYLSANAGDTGSAGALQQTVGSQFGKEQETMQKASGDFVNSAQDQVNKAKIGNDDADKLINESAAQYSYTGNGANQGYTQNVDKVKGALTNQYSGPKEYSYGFDAKTQDYGNAVGKEGNFDGLLKNIYSQRTEKPLSQGQYNLQKQLDVHNTKLNDTRSQLANDYQGLGSKRDETVKNTTDQLGQTEQAYRTNQNALRDYLSGKSTGLDTSISQAEADARKGYEQAASQGTGIGSLGYNRIASALGNQPDIAKRAAHGIWGNNLNYNQLQKEGDVFEANRLLPNQQKDVWWYTADREPELASRRNVLNTFYGEQDAKYANVADEDERKYNTLLDFLGSSDPRKEQGFQVRKK
jgi:hypothetical protein